VSSNPGSVLKGGFWAFHGNSKVIVNQNSIIMKHLLLFAFLSLFFVPTSTYAQCSSSVVNSQVERIDEILQADGYSLTHDVECLSLGDDEWGYYILNLNRGFTYKIVAVCDADCSDMDMKIYDGSGGMADQDVEDDDTPIVNITPSSSGEYALWLKMYDCSVNPCVSAIVVYGKK
jgi:hypothetical protein